MEYLANRRKRGSTSDGNIVAMLSLKLLLLAFFILLSTMSSFEEKRSRAVLESVATTFQGHVAAIRSLDNPTAGLGQLENAPSLVDRLKSLFRQTLPVVEMEESPTGNALRLEVPAESVFVAGSARLAPGRGVLLDRLARILNGEDGPEAAYELQLLHSVRGSGTGVAGELAVRRGGVMARRLSDLGVAEDSLSIALWPRASEGARDGLIAFEILLDVPPRTAGELPAKAPEARP